MTESKSIKFEKGLEELEKIVRQMESGDLSLDDVLKYYESGIKLSRALQQKLDEATRKIEVLSKSKTGVLEEKPLELGGSAKAAVKKKKASTGDAEDLLI